MSAEQRRREQCILSLIQSDPIGTQAALVEALENKGFEVTQATVSRDVRRMGLLKAPHPEGGYVYRAPVARATPGPALASFVVGSAAAESLQVLKTLPGRAMAVAAAIDELELEGVVGTLAGDNLVLILIATRAQEAQVMETLSSLLAPDRIEPRP